jgi:hypothetical protein
VRGLRFHTASGYFDVVIRLSGQPPGSASRIWPVPIIRLTSPETATELFLPTHGSLEWTGGGTGEVLGDLAARCCPLYLKLPFGKPSTTQVAERSF